ncbi:MAG: heme-binding domain-containing protein [Chlorobi bacterium]|nr:heme-binding domain-containing protein [Chlorobiota bacterium]
MKKALKWIGIALLAAFVIIQFIRPDLDNPASIAGQSIWSDPTMTPKVEQILRRSCNDCHSNETVWPWYSNIAPVSWLLASDVEDGRKHLNFSTWLTRPAEKRDHKLEELAEEVQKGGMPLPIYLIMHGDAALSNQDVATLKEWVDYARRQLTAPAAPSPTSMDSAAMPKKSAALIKMEEKREFIPEHHR